MEKRRALFGFIILWGTACSINSRSYDLFVGGDPEANYSSDECEALVDRMSDEAVAEGISKPCGPISDCSGGKDLPDYQDRCMKLRYCLGECD